ncbi:hypothetical protein JYK14_06350 [Siccirubricoccus sp. KC 17139]|uniref:Uncharacterized protein n=1 Tax=Siccirubricoccus soli TaxID=2899147 RepID=A0ABT1D1M3_9PROT|nr:hypothetical protein [Siccirubricoccus soli]MCO6415798.1 hypothetical protein [Siccirubricoccus soli]MCP2681930.1 hypothetical protein [Siccirubricoccus soli]
MANSSLLEREAIRRMQPPFAIEEEILSQPVEARLAAPPARQGFRTRLTGQNAHLVKQRHPRSSVALSTTQLHRPRARAPRLASRTAPIVPASNGGGLLELTRGPGGRFEVAYDRFGGIVRVTG